MRVFLLVTVMLAGCATVAERTAHAERDMETSLRVEGPACEKLGYQKDSDPWRDCVLRLSAGSGPCMHRRF